MLRPVAQSPQYITFLLETIIPVTRCLSWSIYTAYSPPISGLGVCSQPPMDTSFAHHKPHRLKTSGIPSAIALNLSGDHLAVGCSNGDICIWRLPLEGDAPPTHKVCINEWCGVEVSFILWISDTVVTVGRRNGLMAVIKLDYVSGYVSTVSVLSPCNPTETGEPQCSEP